MGFWAAGNTALLDKTAPTGSARQAASWAVAVVLHVFFLFVLGLMISAPDDPEPIGVETPMLVVNIPPPPPPLEAPNEGFNTDISPRFRPRPTPRMFEPAQSARVGSAAEALFRYWCANRPDTAEATGRMCPSDVVMNGLAALPNRGLLNQDDMTSALGMPGYTLEEAGVQRGWRKPRAPSGQDGMASREQSHRDDTAEVFGGFPWDAKPTGR